jgi:hypothetical protein
MVPIALILLAIVILFSVAVVVSNPVAVDMSIFGAQIPVTTSAVYFTGAGAMLVVIVALFLLRTGARRSMARRKEVRTLRREAKAQNATGTSGKNAAGASTTPAGGNRVAETAAVTSAGTSAGTLSGGTDPARSTTAAGPTGSSAAGSSAAGSSAAGTSAESSRAAPAPAGMSTAGPGAGNTLPADSNPSSVARAPGTAAGLGGAGSSSAQPTGSTTAAEREAWLAEIDHLTGGDDSKR